jgi:hypothetical protein
MRTVMPIDLGIVTNSLTALKDREPATPTLVLPRLAGRRGRNVRQVVNSKGPSKI